MRISDRNNCAITAACLFAAMWLGVLTRAKVEGKSPKAPVKVFSDAPTTNGTSITIDEPSFEADGPWKFGRSGAGVNGFFGKSHADYINAGLIDSLPVGGTYFVYNNGPQHDVYQVLQATVAADTTYTLSIMAIDPTFADPFPGGQLRLGYVSEKPTVADDYGLNLMALTNVVNPTPFNDKKNKPNNETDGIATWIYTFTTGANPPGFGKKLRVEVLGGGGVQSLFDNIQLEANAATQTGTMADSKSDIPAARPLQVRPVVVMFGDSTTDRGMPLAVEKQLQTLMPSKLQRPRLINAGKGGDNATSALDRLKRDVLAHHPDIVTVAFGLNDVGVRMPDQYNRSLKKIVKTLNDANIDVVLMTSTPFNNERHGWGKRKEFLELGGLDEYMDKAYCEKVRELVDGKSILLCDLHAIFQAEVMQDPDQVDALVSSDGVHLTAEGYTLIARHVAPLIQELLTKEKVEEIEDAPERVSSIESKPPELGGPRAILKRQAIAIPQDVRTVLNTYCISCHGEKKQEGNVRLDTLASITGDARADLLNTMYRSLRIEEMPPEDVKQPKAAERRLLNDWIGSALAPADLSKLDDKMMAPAYGNGVEHDELFSGEYADLPGFTYDRRWLISEFIFDVKFNRLTRFRPYLDIDGNRQFVPHLSSGFRLNLTNPFLLPTNSGVRYYANETLNGGHLLTMLANAKDTAHLMTTHLARRDSRFLPAASAIMAMEDTHHKTLVSREYFLDRHIEKLLIELYADRHAALLPKFTATKIEAADASKGGKKSNFDAAKPGNEDLELIYRAMLRLMSKAQTDAQLLAMCERQWVIHGHNDRKIQTRLSFMVNYMASLKERIEKHNYRERYKPYDYKPPNDEEMAILHSSILEHRRQGDSYRAIIDKCRADWQAGFLQEQIEAGPASDEQVVLLVEQLFQMIFERSPEANESGNYASLTRTYIESMGNLKAIQKLIQTLILRSEFVYRSEFGQGEADEHCRRMMSPLDASYALAYALTDYSPDAELVKAVKEGRLNTREDYRREITRMLKRRDQYYVVDERIMLQSRSRVTSATNIPIRKLRFFREFFGYPNMLPIFKDNKRFGKNYDNTKLRLLAEADLLVEHILKSDQDVFEKLLTTDRFYVYHTGDNEAMATGSKRVAEIHTYFRNLDWQNFTQADVEEHKLFLTKMQIRADPNSVKSTMAGVVLRFEKGQTSAPPYGVHGISRRGHGLTSPEVAEFFNIKLDNWNYPTTQPAKVEHRKGILTHPAWLIAHARNTETDPIHRGKWIQEKLLAGTIPDVPITVDAAVPEDPHKTHRQRLDAKTKVDYCWSCHQKMNPLGLPFEIYDDFGRFRTEERLEHPENLIEKVKDKGAQHEDLRDIYKTLPVDPRGELQGTGDSSLDGEVTDALNMIERLAKSDRVRQSIIRHAFRYFMGRNEILADSSTLMDADTAYLKSGGSFDAVIVSLLTSDSFIYRKELKD